jgi:hypothetical protein
VLYTAKCFWPGVIAHEVWVAAERARAATAPTDARFRGALFLPADELVLCLFDAASRAGVKRASESAGMPCERVMETVWVSPTTGGGDTTCAGS